ncbi:MAG: carbohydrate porin [Pseudomonadota bacterium]|nr:carbohydrate porin [Pseudomonadota bacterium]
MRSACSWVACWLASFNVYASDADSAAGSTPAQPWAIHVQVTNVTQWHSSFRSPYQGSNSLAANGRTEETTDFTVYAGARLWDGAEFWVNPEIDQGFGLSNTVGAAGYPSGEAYKIGANAPYLRLPRAYLRQSIALGQEQEAVASGANQLAGSRAADALTFTVGKFSVTDLFDTNAYAHDPRSDFLNWSVIDAGAFDYAADAWGFTFGAAAELDHGPWTLRTGLFELSKVPNGKITAVDFAQTMWVGEIEQRFTWRGQPGKVKFLSFVNSGRMAAYADAVRLGQQSGDVPDLSLVRRRARRAGATIDLEQQLSSELGGFARLSANDGRKEAYEFTEINRSFSAGLVLKGDRWGRANDAIGLAGAVNGLSREAREYFAAGGLGILIGDGRLRYGSEQILEATYTFRWDAHLALSADFQRIGHPAYNRDRGPVAVYAVRAHAEF